MEQTFSQNPLLELLNRPAFCVRDGMITQINEAARQRSIAAGEPIGKYLSQDQDAYGQFTGGCLFLTLQIMELPCGAAVTRLEEGDLFLLENTADPTRQLLALAAQQLRQPLNTVYSVTEELANRKQAGQINQGLNQLHRIVCNMSDLVRYESRTALRPEPTDLGSVFAETVEKAQVLLEQAGYSLDYTALPQTVIGMADREMLERAVNNLISNAVKYSPKGGRLDARLTSRGNQLLFTLQDQGDGIPADIRRHIFFRYLREPSIEDSRHGLGLGLALVCSIAACHGGTVLIDQPESGGTRVTMTLTVTPCRENMLHCPVQMLFGDYAGGHDRSLLELSEVLSADAYEK